LSQAAPIVFESLFQAPIVRAQFDVLLVLAECIAPSLPALYLGAPGNWQKVVSVAADALASQTLHVKSIAHAIPIWNRVLLDLGIANLTSAANSVLDTITQRLAAEVSVPFGGEQRLVKMHDAAVDWIKDLGARRGISVLQVATPYPIRVHYNPKGDDYCASSSLFAGEIGWNLQLVERALYGALIMDMLFEHEYLSHMLPKNSFLSRDVREIWLSAGLFWESVGLPGNAAEKHVRETLWELFRRELNKYFDPKNLSFYGPWKLDQLVEKIYFLAPDTFWEIAKAMIECSDLRQNAGAIDAFLRDLLRLPDSALRNGLLSPAQWGLFQSFLVSLI
jgi:hypothetical protein